MKKTKIALTLVCAVLLVAASVMGTLAYMTSTATVTNTFTVGDDIVISLDEAKTNERGVPVDNEGEEVDKSVAPRVTENTYKLMPGLDYTKDPTVHVTGGDCYVFIAVQNPITAIESTATGYDNINTQITKNGWDTVTGANNVPEGYTLYVYAKDKAEGENKVAVKGTTETPNNLNVFAKFAISDTLNSVKAYAEKQIVIKAYAVQVDGFETQTPVAIWNATFGAASSD